jgi:hypothetical protein
VISKKGKRGLSDTLCFFAGGLGAGATDEAYIADFFFLGIDRSIAW